MECIVLTQKDNDKLVTHAIGQQPSESCAMLLGKKVGDNWNIEEVFLTQNVDNSLTIFTISPVDLLEGYLLAENKRLELDGVFHSHPNSDTTPSDTDKKFMQNNPVPWIIFSGITNDLTAYMLDSDVIEIPIK